MGFMYALAGGFASAGDAYSKNQAQQREFNMKQKEADADMLRKQNFARFDYDLRDEYAEKGEKRALEDWQTKETTKEGMKDSQWVTKDGQPISKAEVKEKGVQEGWVRADEYAASRKGELTRKEAGKKRQEELERAEEKFGKDSPEYKAIEKKQFGLSVTERKPGEMTPAEIKREAKDFTEALDNAVKAKSDYGVKSSFAARILEAEGTTQDPQVLKAIKDRNNQIAIRTPEIVSSILGDKEKMKADDFKSKLNQMKIGGKALTAEQKKGIVEYFEYKGYTDKFGPFR